MTEAEFGPASIVIVSHGIEMGNCGVGLGERAILDAGQFDWGDGCAYNRCRVILICH